LTGRSTILSLTNDFTEGVSPDENDPPIMESSSFGIPSSSASVSLSRSLALPDPCLDADFEENRLADFKIPIGFFSSKGKLVTFVGLSKSFSVENCTPLGVEEM
jgi:hypothetical protein